MIERAKVDRNRLQAEATKKGYSLTTLSREIGKCDSYLTTTLNQYDNQLPLGVIRFIDRLGIPKENFLEGATKVKPRDEYDDLYSSVSDAMIDALTSEAFQKALFKAIYGAINLHQLKQDERSDHDSV